MSQSPKRWIIKNEEGIIKGPFTTEEVLDLIGRGEFVGDESISQYPGANWYPISKDPRFYDRLLEVLSGLGAQVEVPDVEPSVSPVPATSGPKPQNDEPTPTPPRIELPKKEKTKTNVKTETKTQTKSHDVIELIDVRDRIKREARKLALKPALVAALILGAGFYLFFVSTETEEERIHLLAPQKGKTQVSAEETRQRTARAVADYQRDTFSSYIRAQNDLVQVLEGGPGNAEVMALLCLTYYELWPFAYQDSQDLKAISQVTQSVSAIDGAGMHAATCKVVDLLLKGRYPEARSLSSSTLETFVANGQPPIPLYYFMAILSESSGDLKTAVGYLSSAEQQWPQWLKAFVYQAQLLAKLERPTEAAQIFRSVLQANPGHDVAKIELGLLEAKYFRNPEKGEELIKAGVKSKDRVIGRVLSRGYFGLAEIYLQRHDSGEALDYARKAYGADSSNSLAKNLVIQLGGSKALSRTHLKANQLIAEGDQFFREGDCNAAQAHYKAAFESDSKSALAAMKAGECLWRLSLTTEAIDWLNKAIRADPKLIEAYVLLADYYSQRYNFKAAAQVLIGAHRIVPKSYEAYRGFALIEYRRNNPKGAIEYAKQALAIYDTDVESHVIMAEALLKLGQFPQAFSHATKAREIDVNHRRAQIVYGQALAGVQGSDTAVSFFTELVKSYPLVSEYRLGLGRQLLEDERWPEAERVFTELTQIDEKSKDAFLELGKVLRLEGRYEDSLKALLKAAVLDPADADPLFQAGILYLDIKKPEEAATQFQRVVRNNKLYPLVHYQLGRAAMLMNNPSQALAEAKEERNLNPNLAEAYLLAAEAYTQLQQYSLCVSEYQQAIKLRPQSAEIYVKVAECYRKSDQLSVAKAMLNQAAQKESGRPDIYRELGIIYEIEGEVTKAIEAYNQYFALSPNAPDRSLIEQRINSLGRRGN